MIKNYILKIVKEVLAEKEADQLFSERETIRVIIKEFVIPGVRSMLGEYINFIKATREIAGNATTQAGLAQQSIERLSSKVNELQAKVDGEVGKEVLKRLLS